MTLTAGKSFSMVGREGGARRESGGQRAGNVNLSIKVSKPEVHFRAHGGKSFSTASEVGGGRKGLGEILKGSEPIRGRGLGTSSMTTTCVCIFITCVYVCVTMCMYAHVYTHVNVYLYEFIPV